MELYISNTTEFKLIYNKKLMRYSFVCFYADGRFVYAEEYQTKKGQELGVREALIQLAKDYPTHKIFTYKQIE